MEAISHAGTVLGVLAKDGVVLAAEKKVTGKLLDLSGATTGGYGGSGEKIFLLNSCVSLSLPFFISSSLLSYHGLCNPWTVHIQKRRRGCCRIHSRRHVTRKLRTHIRPTTSCNLQRGYPRRAAYTTTMQLEAGLHTIRWSTPLRCIFVICRVGSALYIPAVPLRPVGELLWMEGDMYWSK